MGFPSQAKYEAALAPGYCYVLMENHCHRVVMTPEGNLCEIKDPFEAVKWQQVLGGEGFLRKLKDQWNQRVERAKNIDRRNWSAVGAEQILERVSDHFQSEFEKIKELGSRNNLARRCEITLCWDHAGLSLDEIAALFRMPSSNSVAQTIRRTKTTTLKL